MFRSCCFVKLICLVKDIVYILDSYILSDISRVSTVVITSARSTDALAHEPRLSQPQALRCRADTGSAHRS